MPEKTKTAYCPACDVPMQLKAQIRIGTTVECTACTELLEVVDTSPLTLDWVYEDGDDEIDFDDDYDDD